MAWNRFAYVYNDPVNNVDPSGHFVVAAIDTAWDAGRISASLEIRLDLYSDLRHCFGDSDSMACYMAAAGVGAIIAGSLEGPSNNVARRAAKAADVGEGVQDVARRVDDVVPSSRALVPYDPEFAARQADLRRVSGMAYGGDDLPIVSGRWLRGTEGNVGRIPGQIADQLRGRSFENFGEFREALWKAVADDPYLATHFDEVRNLPWMRKGYAPYVLPSQRVGRGRAQRKYILHYIELISEGGGVYDLGNILVVTPRYHNLIHYGR